MSGFKKLDLIIYIHVTTITIDYTGFLKQDLLELFIRNLRLNFFFCDHASWLAGS